MISLDEYQYLDGWTLLHHAANFPNPEMIKILVDYGCNINQQTTSMKYTPLHLAVLKKDLPACELLLKMGADPNLADTDFFTPMHYIVNYEYVEILDLFLTF